MERLINDLMYFSRLGRADLAVQRTDPNALLIDIQQMMETVLSERHARIVVPRLLPEIVCDKTRVTEVFRNLITNAVKYNDKTEKLVEVGFLESVNTKDGLQRGVFYVKDNGSGIDPEFHQEIFRIFKRLQSASDGPETGTGVGLTFVKKIVERHGGRIWLESEPGNGTVFYFNLTPGRPRTIEEHA
jgi:signal transduction histidine kinase